MNQPDPERILTLLRDSLLATRAARESLLGEIALTDAAVDEYARNAAQVLVFALDTEDVELDESAVAVVEGKSDAEIERGIVKALDRGDLHTCGLPLIAMRMANGTVESGCPYCATADVRELGRQVSAPRARLLAEDIDRGNAFGFDVGGESWPVAKRGKSFTRSERDLIAMAAKALTRGRLAVALPPPLRVASYGVALVALATHHNLTEQQVVGGIRELFTTMRPTRRRKGK